MPRRRRALLALLLGAGALSLAGCAGLTGAVAAAPGGRVSVVAAENVWGSIAGQLAGREGRVTSIIANPAQDPHSYEPTTADARTLATAQLVIVNGLGYDPWMPKLLAADAASGRHTLSVGRVLGLRDGANPHRWYAPADVARVAGAITAALERLAPRHRAYFVARLAHFDTTALRGYHALIADIRRRYAGVPVGASESIFAPLAPALGLRLITPPGFLRAGSEGAELTAAQTLTAERQLTGHQIKVWVRNSQNVTPEIGRLDGLARTAGIPVVTVTETLTPAATSFQAWQVGQLQRLAAALHRATGR